MQFVMAAKKIEDDWYFKIPKDILDKYKDSDLTTNAQIISVDTLRDKYDKEI